MATATLHVRVIAPILFGTLEKRNRGGDPKGRLARGEEGYEENGLGMDAVRAGQIPHIARILAADGKLSLMMLMNVYPFDEITWMKETILAS